MAVLRAAAPCVSHYAPTFGALLAWLLLMPVARIPACIATIVRVGFEQQRAPTTLANAEARPTLTNASADELFNLAAFKGKVVYLDFWASWCAPCRESFPWMNRMQTELGPAGLVVIAVDVDRERADAERFIRELAPQFRVVFDPEGVLPEKFGVRGMPTSFLIDRNGHVQSRHEGFRLADRDVLAQQIRSLVLAHSPSRD